MLKYGQHPRRAMPFRSWPLNGRVGGRAPVAPQRRYDTGAGAGPVPIKPEIRRMVDRKQILAEDRVLTEFIQTIVASGILE